MEQRKWRILFFAAVTLFVVAYGFSGGSLRESITGVFAIALMILGYAAGFLALAIHGFLLFVGFILSLPVISTIYAAVLALLAKLHYIVFKSIFKRSLQKTPWYKKTEAKIKKSKIYQDLTRRTHNLLNTLGIRMPKTVHMFEMSHCPRCKKEIPAVGRFCPYCRSSLEE